MSSRAHALALVELGRVVKAHGLGGELVVAPHGRGEEALLGVGRLYLRREGSKARPWPVLRARRHGARVIVALDGLQGREKAEAWRHAAVLARARDVAAAAPQHWGALLWVGRVVAAVQGHELGRLETVSHVAGQELWTIVGAQGARYLVPAALCREVREDRLLLDLPEGLLECCRQDAGG